MTQDEKWHNNFQAVKEFIDANHRNPSRHRIEEHLLLNWVKQQRKLMNAGKMKPERIEPFNKLMDIWEKNRRVNQYQ